MAGYNTKNNAQVTCLSQISGCARLDAMQGADAHRRETYETVR